VHLSVYMASSQNVVGGALVFAVTTSDLMIGITILSIIPDHTVWPRQVATLCQYRMRACARRCVLNCTHSVTVECIYRGADKSLARPTSRFILFDGENISFDASLVIYINSTNIPPIMIINRIYENQNRLSL